MANDHSSDESSCCGRILHRRISKLTVSKYEGGARPLRAAAPAFLLRLLAATSAAAAGGKCDGVKSYHALRVYHTHPRGNPSFIGVVMGHLGTGAERCVKGAIICEIPAILGWPGRLHCGRQGYPDEISVQANLSNHKGIDS